MHHLLGTGQPSISSLPLQQLRDAINGLYCGVESIQRPANAWLQSFRTTPGSWRLCVHLLDDPHLHEHECYFAANNIKASCQKHQDVLEPGSLGELLAKLALHTQACLHKQQWAAASQLSAAAASLAVRAPSLLPSGTVQDLLVLFLSAPAAAAAGAAATATAAELVAQSNNKLGAAGQAYTGQIDSAGTASAAAAAATASRQTLGLHLQQDPVAVAVMLKMLTALPEAALSKQTSVHPDRRTAVTDSLKQSAWPAPILQVALCSRNAKLVALACEAIVSWCEMGVPPQGMASQGEALDALAAALLGTDTAAKACEAFAAMLTACKESSSGSSTTSGPSAVLLVQLLQQLQGNVLPVLAAEHQTMGLAATAAGGAAAAGGGNGADRSSQASADAAAYSAVVRSHLGADAEAAFCRVLCAAAAALLRPVMQGAVALQGLLELLLQQLLLSVGISEDGVAMTAVDFWQDSYLATLQALPHELQGQVLVQQRGVLETLTAALVRRTQLSPAAAASCTADARDLPEEMRMVRRESASALRDIGDLLGPTAMLLFVTQLTATAYQHLCDTHQSANPRCNRNCVPGLQSALGLHGIVAGLAAGSDVYGTTGGPRWGPVAAAVDGRTAAAGPAAAGAAHDAGPCAVVVPGDWLPLESGLYAANVVLGKQRGEAAVQQVQQLAQYAAAAISHPGGSLKLAGTALTLLGGLAAWLAAHPESLSTVLAAIAHALRSPDDKLARNAATCMQRLTSSEELSVQLTRQHPEYVKLLLQEYQARGGLANQAVMSQGDDKPTEELLLLSLCSLAVAHTSNSSDIDRILVQLVGPQLTVATEELAAALRGNWPQQQLYLHPRHHHSRSAGGLQVHLLQQQQQQQDEAVVTSTAVRCLKALTSLIAGLPTGVSKHALGLPMHARHPRHQQQLHQHQQQHSAAVKGGGIQQHDLAAAAAGHGSVVGEVEDDASMCSASVVSDISSNAMHSNPGSSSMAAGAGPAATARAAHAGQLSNCLGRCSHLHCQQKAQADAAALQLRQYRACFIVSQMLHRASHPVMLALRAAAAAPEQQALLARQLLSSACSFLLAALPAAVHYQRASAGNSSGNTRPETSSSSSAAAVGAAAAGGSELQSGLLLLQLCQLLEQLPVQLLQQPCCLQLLSSLIAAAAAAAAGSEAQLSAEAQQQQQCLALLQKLVGQSLAASCASILAQDGAADPDHTCAAVALATVSLQQCPEVLAAADLDSLLVMSLAGTKTYHLKQCTAVLEWVQVLAQVAYDGQQQQPGLAAAAAVGGKSSSTSAAVVAAFRQRLESCGVGPRLVLALLLAASGAMPPDVVLPVSHCLHSVRLSVGPPFVDWLQTAVLQLAPEGAPWQRQRHVAKVTFVSDLTDAACLTDTTRFKRILKNFCGGKKKGAGGGRH